MVAYLHISQGRKIFTLCWELWLIDLYVLLHTYPKYLCSLSKLSGGIMSVFSFCFPVFVCVPLCVYISLQRKELNGWAFHVGQSICLATHSSFGDLTLSVHVGLIFFCLYPKVFSGTSCWISCCPCAQNFSWEASVSSPIGPMSYLMMLRPLLYPRILS